MKKLNKNKGITLIALVISIIVMLILVAVSISMAVNGGLFNYAGKAVGDTQNEIDKEKELADGRIKVGNIWYDSLQDVADGKPSANQGEGTVTTPDTPKEDGKIEIPEGLKVGDYVNYTPTAGTYTVASGENGSGYTSEQSFTTETGENALEWRVWSIDEEKGTVELISATAAHNLYLQGADGYNHGVDILNDLCKALYSNTNGATARSINVEDINAKATYDYKNYEGTYKYGQQVRLSTYGTGYMKYPNLYSQEKGYGTANEFLQSLGESTGLNDGVTNNGVTSYGTVTGYTDGNTAGTDPYVTYTYYYYTPESNLKTDQGVNTVPAGLINLGKSYWLASRCVYSSARYAYFYVRIMKPDGGVYRDSLFNSSGSWYNPGCACRPVVSLNSNVSLTLDETNTTESITYWNIEY